MHRLRYTGGIDLNRVGYLKVKLSKSKANSKGRGNVSLC